MGFNPRPREGGDPGCWDRAGRAVRVSIHAPAKGATIDTPSLGEYSLSFNPRPREGGDDVEFIYSLELKLVSIHAPAKGATSPSGRRRRIS